MLFLALLLLSACTHRGELKATDYYDRQILQSGMLSAATGPHLLGPQLEPGQIAVQGALEYSGGVPARVSRESGASGGMLASFWGRGLVSAGLWPFLQIGVEIEGSPAQLARPLATDVDPSGWNRALWRAGVDVRARFHVGRVTWTLFNEVEVSSLRYQHSDRTVETVFLYDNGEAIDQWSETTGSSDFVRTKFLSGRMGGSLGLEVGAAELHAGPFLQTAPWLYGSWRDHWGCDQYAYDSECIDPTEPPPDVTILLVPGLFADASLPVGPKVWLNAAAWLTVDPGQKDGSEDLLNGSGELEGYTLRPGGTASLLFMLGRVGHR